MTQRVALPYLSSAGLASTSVGSSVSNQYGGPVGVQTFTQALGSHNSQFHLPFPLTSNKQAELLERLKQLRTWQQQQQADLLRQQQEQLLKLRNENMTLEPMLRDQGERQDSQTKNADEVNAKTEEAHEVADEEDSSGRPSKCHLSPDESEIVPESTLSKRLEVHSNGDASSYQDRATSQDDGAQWEPETCSVSDNEEHHPESDFHHVSAGYTCIREVTNRAVEWHCS